MFDNAVLVNEMDNLKKFAYRLTNNQWEAEDLLQSTILRAFEKRHLYKEETKFFGWASKIMFNLFVSEYRRKTRFATQYDPQSYIDRESIGPSQETLMEWKNVQDAMQSLSAEHRDILIMICIQGMQYSEAAESLGIPMGTVRSRLSRARESLQNVLDQGRYGKGGPLAALKQDIRTISAQAA